MAVIGSSKDWGPAEALQRPLPQFSHAPPTAEGPVGSPVASHPSMALTCILSCFK